MGYFIIEEDKSPYFTGTIEARHQWGLPGIRRCPACKATWGDNFEAFPSVDLTPVATLANFDEPRAEPIEEYERMAELVRPLLPPRGCAQTGN